MKRLVVADNGCWEWPGYVNPPSPRNPGGGGYAKLCGEYIHRLSYTFFHGPIPTGMVVDHLCHTEACTAGRHCRHRRCWNPWHLGLASRAANIQRSADGRRRRKAVA